MIGFCYFLFIPHFLSCVCMCVWRYLAWPTAVTNCLMGVRVKVLIVIVLPACQALQVLQESQVMTMKKLRGSKEAYILRCHFPWTVIMQLVCNLKKKWRFVIEIETAFLMSSTGGSKKSWKPVNVPSKPKVRHWHWFFHQDIQVNQEKEETQV